MKILVVEDKEYNVQSAIQLLAGHEVVAIKDATEAMMELSLDSEHEFDYEMVLLDMLMPNSDWAKGNQYLKDSETPYGLLFLWMAVARGAKYVGLLSSKDHHHHTISAAMDFFPENKLFKVDQATVCLFGGLATQNTDEGLRDDCGICSGSGEFKNKTCEWCRGDKKVDVYPKDWLYIFNFLTGVATH